MNPITRTKHKFNQEITRLATANIERKLKKQGINPHRIDPNELEDLIADEITILQSDTKKVGVGIGIGLVLSMLTGL